MGETVHRAMPCGRSPARPLLRDKSVPEGMEPDQKTAQLSHINETLTFGRDRDVRSGFGEFVCEARRVTGCRQDSVAVGEKCFARNRFSEGGFQCREKT